MSDELTKEEIIFLKDLIKNKHTISLSTTRSSTSYSSDDYIFIDYNGQRICLTDNPVKAWNTCIHLIKSIRGLK